MPPSFPAIELESAKLVEIPCNLCGADDPRLVCTDEGYRICRCAVCNLIYVTPQPAFSSGLDVSFHTDSEVASDRGFREEKNAVYEQGLAELNRLRPEKGPLLDVGCGFGLFLEQAGEMGWEPFGIDVSEVSVAHARQNLGLLNVKRSDLGGSGFSSEFFQAVTLWNVLEHVPDPSETLTQVHRILSGNGVVLVRVPNMLVHNALRRGRSVLRPLLGLLGSRLPPYLGGISPPHHLFGFTPRTLKLMLERAGYADVEIHPAVPHGTRSALGMTATAIARVAYLASLRRLVISPAIVAYGRRAQ